MSNLPRPPFGITAEDLRNCDWQSRLAQGGRKKCSSHHEVLATLAESSEKAGDDRGWRVYSLLSAVASFCPNYDAQGNAYGPALILPDGRSSLMAEDLTDDDLDALRAVLEEIQDAEFRARVGDVLWESKRDYKAAQISVRAFIDAAQRLKTDDLWPPYAERLERAAQLSARLGFGKPLHKEALGAIESAIKEFDSNPKSGLLCHRLMSVLLAHEFEKTAEYAALAERWATELAGAGASDFSHRYWQLAARWYRKAKNESDEQRCLLAAAEGIVAAAEKGLQDGNLEANNAAFWIGKAVEELRQAKANPARVKDVHRRFLELQKQALGQMRPTTFDFEDSEFAEAEEKTREAAANHVRGHSFEEALARLIYVANFTNVDALRQQMEEKSKELIWDKLMDSEALDSSGKVSDKLPATGFGESGDDTSLRKKMVLMCRQVHWQVEATWKIDPARAAILDEHGVRRHDLIFLIAGNPFIPPGHHGIYLRGFQAGFYGDWLVAMHLLIPQVEASIRHVFQQSGAVTSTLDAEGIQQERDINQLVWMPEMEQIFGKDIAFDLRGILIERFGHNLRNDSAHALIPEGAFYQPAAVYLWWMLLRLCWMGYSIVHRQEVGESS